MNVEETARAWLADPARPRVDCAVQRSWDRLLDEWVNDESAPLLIRKSSLNRGAIYHHHSGREVVPTDNSPANWALSSAIRGIVPTLAEALDALRAGRLPVTFAFKVAEKPFAVFKGLRNQMRDPPCLNKIGWKVCHIDGVAGEYRRQKLDKRDLRSLQDEMRRFLMPSNMFVVHLKPGGHTYGLGDQIDFVKVFREDRERSYAADCPEPA